MSPLSELLNEVDEIVKMGGPVSGFILIVRRPDADDDDLEHHEIIADDDSDDGEVANILRSMAELVEVDGLHGRGGKELN